MLQHRDGLAIQENLYSRMEDDACRNVVDFFTYQNDYAPHLFLGYEAIKRTLVPLEYDETSCIYTWLKKWMNAFQNKHVEMLDLIIQTLMQHDHQWGTCIANHIDKASLEHPLTYYPRIHYLVCQSIVDLPIDRQRIRYQNILHVLPTEHDFLSFTPEEKWIFLIHQAKKNVELVWANYQQYYPSITKAQFLEAVQKKKELLALFNTPAVERVQVYLQIMPSIDRVTPLNLDYTDEDIK